MIYYIFNSQSEANLAEQKIVDNIRNWVSINAPDALSEDGTKLKGRNASTGQLVEVYTERWAIPQQTNDNKWVFPKPTIEKTSPIPVEIFLQNINAIEVDYNSEWFSSNNPE